MLIKNNSGLHVQIPGTMYSIRPYRTIEIPEGNYNLPKELEIIVEKKINKKGD